MAKSPQRRTSNVLSQRRANRRSQRGATAVEFAIVAPILFLLIFCAFEFARLCMIKNLAQDAAYEAARYAMVQGSDAQDAIDQANMVLATLGTRNVTVVVNDGAGIDEDTEAVKVAVTIPMKDNSFGLIPFVKDKTISAEITLIAERYNGFYASQRRKKTI
jgi:Flp pilus assembly protein TadG